MAGDWIKMRKDLAEDPAVIGIAERLGHAEYAVIGMLHRFWSWADAQTTDGNARGVTGTWLDRYIGVSGFTIAMSEVGWLTLKDGAMSIPNFDRHNGQTAKARGLTANRVARHRNAGSVTAALPEKRREEKRRDKTKKHSPPPSAAGESGQWPESKLAQHAEQIHAAYPKRVGHAASIKAAVKAIRVLAPRHGGDHGRAYDWLLARVRAYAESPLVQTTDRQFIPHPATWLNAGSYDDDESAWAARTNGQHRDPPVKVWTADDITLPEERKR